jgi:hypothetical protein
MSAPSASDELAILPGGSISAEVPTSLHRSCYVSCFSNILTIHSSLKVNPASLPQGAPSSMTLAEVNRTWSRDNYNIMSHPLVLEAFLCFHAACKQGPSDDVKSSLNKAFSCLNPTASEWGVFKCVESCTEEFLTSTFSWALQDALEIYCGKALPEIPNFNSSFEPMAVLSHKKIACFHQLVMPRGKCDVQLSYQYAFSELESSSRTDFFDIDLHMVPLVFFEFTRKNGTLCLGSSSLFFYLYIIFYYEHLFLFCWYSLNCRFG